MNKERASDRLNLKISLAASRSSSRRERVSARPRTFVDHTYHDHLHDPYNLPQVVTLTNTPKQSKKTRGGVYVAFPERLHDMLTTVAEEGLADIVSWQKHGRCFLVHDKNYFVEKIIPRFFHQSKLTSFQRQLNLYGFIRLTAGSDRGAYYHELFLRGRRDLCRRMARKRIKGNGKKAASSPMTEPDFYEMEYCKEAPEEPPAAAVSSESMEDDDDDDDDDEDYSSTSASPTTTSNYLSNSSSDEFPAIVSPSSSSLRQKTFAPDEWPSSLFLRPYAAVTSESMEEDEESSLASRRTTPNYLSSSSNELPSVVSPCSSALLQKTQSSDDWPSSRPFLRPNTPPQEDLYGPSIIEEHDDDDDDAPIPHNGDEVFFEGHKFRYLEDDLEAELSLQMELDSEEDEQTGSLVSV